MSTLIIGGGLAGICLAEQLSDINETFLLVQPKDKPSSTAVATGMYNPIVFKRLNLSWKVDLLIPDLIDFYECLETKLGVKLIEKHGLFKKIRNESYESLWKKRLNDLEYQAFMGEIEHSFGEVKNTGIVDCELLQTTYLNLLNSEGLLLQQEFLLNELEINDSNLIYNEQSFDRIIFCEGAFAVENPYFKWLPFKLCKGEWITIKTETNITDRLLNNKVNIIPIGNNHYKLSSTFSWEDLDWEITQEAVTELLEDFTELFDVPFEVVDQRAAIRPTVADRRPYLGSAFEDKRIFIFNGLGSKGVMLAPYFSKHLVNHIFNNEKLDPEVDIMRHHKRYYNQPEKT